MSNPLFTVRFGLVLEAFCRGLCSHLKGLIRQVEAMDKLTLLSDTLKEKRNEAYKDRNKFFKEQIQQSDYLEALQNFCSPVNAAQYLGQLQVEPCRILDSAKKPLWLVWENPDPMAELFFTNHAIIFKSGDGKLPSLQWSLFFFSSH